MSIASQNRDGHVDRVGFESSPQTSAKTGETQGDVDRVSGRLALEWDVTSDFMATVTADMSVIREESPGQYVIDVDETLGLASLHNNVNVIGGVCAVAAGPSRLTNPLCYNDQIAFDIDELKTTGHGPNQSDADIFGVALTLDWNVGPFDLKSISAYRDVEVDVIQDLHSHKWNYGVIAQFIEWDQFTQELHISGAAFDGRLSYLGGLYYSTEEGRQVFPVEFRNFGFDSGGEIDNESYAVFGQATYDITDKMALTVGVRYTDETRRFDPSLQQVTNYFDPNATPLPGYFNVLNGAFGPIGTQLFPPGVYKRESDGTTPMASLSYQFTDDFMVYASYSEGFKGGGFSMRYFPAITPPPGLTGDDIIGYADPETAESYEIGMKSEFFDSRMRLNASAFYIDYDDLQLTLNVDVGGPLLVPSLANAGVAEIKGIEVELDAVPTDWLSVQASLGYIDADYDSFSDLAISQFPAADTFEIQNTPEVTVHVGGTATVFDNEKGRLFLRADYSWRDDQVKDFANFVTQESYGILDASLTYATADDKWLVSLGGTNITDEIYLLSAIGDLDVNRGTASRPAEWYLRLKYNF